MFLDIGVKVTLIEYLPQIVPLEDGEISKLVQRSFEKRGMTVMTNARFDPAAVSKDKDGICVMVGEEGKEPQEVRAEMMLVATGRAANIEDIGLETTKVETDRGVIKVNGKMRTKEPHVYAIGDIIGGLWLAHTAAHEGLIAAHVIAGDADVHEMDYTKQPRATYCRPEIASIGLTEEQVKAAGTPYKVGKVPFQAIAKAIIAGEYEGFAKVISNTENQDILGVHIVGPHATDLIAEASLAFEFDATAWEVGGSTHAHPTLSEVIGEAAMAVDGRSINF
jgi:dihydrolipoamide dehydrogenase